MNLNIYNPYVRAELELYHHGIAGQKWGKRNGPPYPLSAGAHSASEKKAGWKKSLDNDGKTERKIQRLGKKYDKLVLKAEKGNPSKRLLQKMDKTQEKYEEAVGQSQKRKGSTGHPKAEPTLEKELAFLSDTAKNGGFDNPELGDIHVKENIDRYIAFQKKIVDDSINWYEDEPKSERAKAWKKEREDARNKFEQGPIATKYRNNEKRVNEKINELNKEIDRIQEKQNLTDEQATNLYIRKRKELDKKYSRDEIWRAYWDAKEKVDSAYDRKLVDIVLKDLGIPVTDENRKYIRDSQVLFWD